MENKDSNAKRVLVVDDQEEILDFYTEIIREVYSPTRVSIEISKEGTSALAWMQKEKFDFIMIDINMPGKNGIDVILESFKTGINQETPVCMISGYLSLTDDILQDEAFQNVILVQKPFEEPTIKRHLKLALKLPA